MKKVVISIDGNMRVFWKHVIVDANFGNIDETDELALMDECKLDEDLREFIVMTELNAITAKVNGQDIDIQNSKGKYVKSKEVLKKELKIEDGEALWIGDLGSPRMEFQYEIELEDNDAFDPKKVQLIKSDYELDFLPYGIITRKILYDGKEITTTDEEGYWGTNIYDVHYVNYNLPYES